MTVMATDAPEITVTRVKVWPNAGFRGAWYWLYECTGPDGRQFNNRSIITLRSRLREVYGKVEIVEPWKT